MLAGWRERRQIGKHAVQPRDVRVGVNLLRVLREVPSFEHLRFHWPRQPAGSIVVPPDEKSGLIHASIEAGQDHRILAILTFSVRRVFERIGVLALYVAQLPDVHVRKGLEDGFLNGSPPLFSVSHSAISPPAVASKWTETGS